MFGFPSFPKLLVVALVVFGVWYFLRAPANNRKSPAGGQRRGKRKAQPVEDMTPCPACGTYIAPGSACDCKQKVR